MVGCEDDTDGRWSGCGRRRTSWAEIESLLTALRVSLIERAGSRVQLIKGTDSIVVHRPHPRPEARRDTVRDIARFIERIGED